MSQNHSEFSRAAIGAAIAAGVGSFVSIAPIVAATFSTFMGALVDQYHWGRGDVSLAITLCALVGGAVTPYAGRLVDRLGVRRVMIPAVAAFGLSVMSVSLAQDQLWQVYLFYCLIGVTAGFQNMVAYSKVVSMWFSERRGAVLSIVTACYGLSGFLMVKFVAPIIAQRGWRAGYVFLGGVVLLSLLVIVPLLKLPEGATPTGGKSMPAGDAPGDTPEAARQTWVFWLLVLVLFLAVTAILGTTAHVVPMLKDRGIAPMVGAGVSSLIFLGSMIGQLSYGYLVDRFNTPRIAVPFFICSFIGATTLHYSTDLATLKLGAILMGIGQGSELGLAAYFVGRYFGVRHLGAIYGSIYAGATVASGIGPYIMGQTFQMLGTYKPMMIAFEVSLLLAVIGVATLKPYVYQLKRSEMRK